MPLSDVVFHSGNCFKYAVIKGRPTESFPFYCNEGWCSQSVRTKTSFYCFHSEHSCKTYAGQYSGLFWHWHCNQSKLFSISAQAYHIHKPVHKHSVDKYVISNKTWHINELLLEAGVLNKSANQQERFKKHELVKRYKSSPFSPSCGPFSTDQTWHTHASQRCVSGSRVAGKQTASSPGALDVTPQQWLQHSGFRFISFITVKYKYVFITATEGTVNISPEL